MQKKQWMVLAAVASMLAMAGCADDPETESSCTENEVWNGTHCVAEDNENCGLAGNVCTNGNVCINHRCQCQNPSTGEAVECSTKGWVCGNGVCANTDSDNNNCGSIGHKCDVAQGMTCYLGSCTDNCQGDTEMCVLPDGSGTCVDTASNRQHCGSCNHECAGADASKHVKAGYCSDGECAITCEVGWEDADDNAQNGCEKEIDTSKSICGNQVVEAGEVCDGKKLNDQTCATIVGPGSVGDLYCLAGCQGFDSSHCSKPTTCGNGAVDGQEVCDGRDVNGKTCAEVVGEGSVGSLGCSVNCGEFDTTGCSAPTTCGNGKLDEGEVCDHDKLNNVTCASYVGVGSEGTIRCNDKCSGYDISECSAASKCGNGRLEEGEECDGVSFANGATCEKIVGEGSKGALQCDVSCKIVATQCSPRTTCGNGSVDPGEVCDGKQLNSQTCADVVGEGSVGNLSCLNNCTGYDISNCTAPSSCGNGYIEAGEACDSNRLNDQTCASILGEGATGVLRCNNSCTGFETKGCTIPQTKCGNGILEDATEVCDGAALNGKTCADIVGPGSKGTLLCGDNCKYYNLSGCSAPSTCGNGTIDNGEVCEPGNVNGKTCADIVGSGSQGTLKCGSSCYSFDTSSCSAPVACGNGSIDAGEVCDNTNVAGQTCAQLVGYGSKGVVRCAKNCASLDTTGCSPEVTCGNGKLDNGEVCDGNLLNGASCAARVGYGSKGELKCNSTCSGYDTSNCSEAVKCGNGVLDAGEVCDGFNVNGATCASKVGFGSTGNVVCNLSCTGYDTTNCTAAVTCGNSRVDAGEVCDGTILKGATCESVLGSGSTGAIRCNNTCDGYDTTNCSAPVLCGNGTIDPGEECDKNKFNGSFTSCSGYNSMLYTSGGTLKCADNCTIDTSECISWCGNGSLNATKGEVCDGDKLNNKTCATQVGVGSTGSLSCADDCMSFNLNDCTAPTICGDGIVNQNSEECDITSFRKGSADCSAYSSTYKSGTNVQCLSNCVVDTSMCETKPYCGDGIVNGTEECDGTKFLLDKKTCAGWDPKYASGSVKCNNSTCTIDYSACVEKPITPTKKCGNNILDDNEVCDGDKFYVTNCSDYSAEYTTGKLKCTDTCEFDTSECKGYEPSCGNGVLDPGEDCDNKVMRFSATQTACNAYDSSVYQKGTISCTSDCKYDFSACKTWCGNGAVNNSGGVVEACDHSATGDKFSTSKNTCAKVMGSGYTGDLACSEDCSTIITTGCKPPVAKCGDGIVNNDELCDKTAFLDNATACKDWNSAYTGGTMKCNADCTLDESGCTKPAEAKCGDGIVNGSAEECDINAYDPDLNTCEKVDSKYSGGTLKCTSKCEIDESGCVLKQVQTCGNGKLDDEEWCDNDKFDPDGNTCDAWVPGSTGTLSCNSDCSVNTTNCKPPVCGDGKVNQETEFCDKTALADGFSFNCADWSSIYSSGTMTCNSDCEFDESNCKTRCGNGVLDDDEFCDTNKFIDNDNQCANWLPGSIGTVGCTRTCEIDTSSCVAAPTAHCGDGIVNTDAEECDNNSFFMDVTDCKDYSSVYESGKLGCNNNCTVNESACVKKAVSACGDGKYDSNTEECDAGQFMFGIKSCVDYSESYSSGMLKCNDKCEIDTSACVATVKCGNGKLDADEWCDGKLFIDDAKTCAEWGDYTSGNVSCTSTCELSFAGCTKPKEASCGDGVVNQDSEECDGESFLFNEKTCAGWNSKYVSGNVTCNTATCKVEYGACKDASSLCGNGRIDEINNEWCDKTAFLDGANKCTDWGDYASGTMSCNADCTLNFKNCVNKPTAKCGDGIVNNNEECDKDAFLLDETSCAGWDPKYVSGKVSCNSNCTLNYSACKEPEVDKCGDTILGENEYCDGDLFMFGVTSCAEYDPANYVGGNLKCTECEIDTSDCVAKQKCPDADIRCVGPALEMCMDGIYQTVTVCSGSTPVCDAQSEGCIAGEASTNVTWCAFQWLEASDHMGYGRILLPSGSSPEDVVAGMFCTNDLSKPFGQWTEVSAEHNASCGDCYANTEYMTSTKYAGKPGVNYCVFAFMDDNAEYICRPAQNGDLPPIIIKDSTIIDASFTRTFTNAGSSCTESDIRCVNNNVEICDDGVFILYDECATGTVCNAETGDCDVPSTTSYDVTETFETAKANTSYASNYSKDYGNAGKLTLKNAAFYDTTSVIDGMTAIFNGKNTTTLTITGFTGGIGTLSFDYKFWSASEGNVTVTITDGVKSETISKQSDTEKRSKSVTFNNRDNNAVVTITATSSSKSRILVDNVRWTSAY